MGNFKMISAARFFGLATACATLLIAGALVEPASAQDEACKADIVTAAGKGKFRPFTKTKELEGRGAAMADAVANWQQDVSDKFGEQWKSWSKAKDTTFNCAPTKTGKIIGSSFIGCTISGRPCSLSAPPGGGAVVDGDSGGGRTRDKGSPPAVPPGRRAVADGDSGGGGRTRDKGRRVGEQERLKHEDRVYEREMAYQNNLAAERRKAETRAYEREMAHQKYLAAERRRAESEALERENAHQRYLAEERRRIERERY
jgi:hypothetical protein